MRTSLYFLLIVFIISCKQTYINEKIVSKKENEFSKNYIDSLSLGAIDYCFNLLLPEYQDDKAWEYFHSTHENLSERKKINSKIIGFSKTKMKEYAYTHLEYEYQYENDWAYFIFDLIENDGTIKIQRFNANGYPESLVKANEFNFTNKSIKHYFALILTVGRGHNQ